MFLDGRLARVDNTFQLTRRLFNAFERPIGTPSGQNAVWHTGTSPTIPRWSRSTSRSYGRSATGYMWVTMAERLRCGWGSPTDRCPMRTFFGRDRNRRFHDRMFVVSDGRHPDAAAGSSTMASRGFCSSFQVDRSYKRTSSL